jgi:glycosyltransferase involved in cell wall biosynthesis
LLSEKAMVELREEMEVVGAVPRSEIAKHYGWADVFVLPTLSEGSANVVYEALAAGLPVITTPNAGSIIRDGGNGFLVPIRDAGKLAEAIMKLKNSSALRASSSAAGGISVPDFNEYASNLCYAVQPAELANG